LTSYGIQRLALLQEMRKYIRETPVSQLVREVKRIKELDYLRVILAAGARDEMFQAILDRIYELTR